MHLYDFFAAGRNHTKCCVRRGVTEDCSSLCQFRDSIMTIEEAACIRQAGEIFTCMKEGHGKDKSARTFLYCNCLSPV